MFRDVTSKDLGPKTRKIQKAAVETAAGSLPAAKAIKLTMTALKAAKKARNAKKVAALTKKVKKLRETLDGSAPGTNRFPPPKQPRLKGNTKRAEPRSKPAKKAAKKTKSSAETTEFKAKTRQKGGKSSPGKLRDPSKTSRRTRERTPVEKKARKKAIELKRKTPDAPKPKYYEGQQRFGRTGGYGAPFAKAPKPKKLRGYEGKTKRRPRPQPEY